MLRDLQREFRAAVLGPDDGILTAHVAAPRGSVAARIDVYRNTVQASLAEVLATAFPVVARIVGPAFFANLARAFIAAQPPRVPQLSRYGEAFAAFIADKAADHQLPYLADVARLEWARGVAYFAADAPLLDPAKLAQAGERVGDLRFDVHPATSLIRSEFPVFTIWTANQPDIIDVPPIEMTRGESALVSRPHMAVMTRAISEGDAAFVETITKDAALGAAATTALDQYPTFDLQGALELHLRHGTFTAVR